MDRRDIEGRAVFMAFPTANRTSARRYFSDRSHRWELLPDTHEVYEGSMMNKHHYTTRYHRDKVLPTLERSLSFGFDRSRFRLVANAAMDGDYKMDLGYLAPLDEMRFRVIAFNYKICYESGFPGLMRNKRTAGVTWTTPYHDLFCLPHTSSTVRNLSGGNGRSLLVLGDSQMIPSLPVLCTCYRTVTYIDNRDGKPVVERMDKRYDDVLVSIYEKDVDYYFGFLV